MRAAFLCALLLSALAGRSAELTVPPLSATGLVAGKRGAVTPPEYRGTAVHHLVCLPDDWTPDWKQRGRTWPVIVEYTGNYFPAAGSTGEVEGAALGHGLSRGRYLWVVLPYVAQDRRHNEITWWGDIDATVNYAKTNVPRVCAEFGGDPRRVVLCGFSRGAIATGFIGLHDDEIAGLWCGLLAHDHFDGVREWKNTAWGSPLARYREEATVRLRRLQGRPLLVTQGSTEPATRDYLAARLSPGTWSYLEIDMRALFGSFPNEFAKHPHNDRWLLRDSTASKETEEWLQRTLRNAAALPPPGR